MGLSALERFLWAASAVLAAAIIWRIIQQKLWKSPFRAFGLMLGVVLARDVIVSIPPYDTPAYTLAWAWTLPILLAAQVWAGLDTLRAVARLYPKIGNFAVRLFLACLAITIFVCCVGLPFELDRLGREEAALRSLFLLHRWADSCIAGTLILVAVFFARFPAPLKQPPRNLVMHTMLLSAYFSGYAVLFFAENLASLGAIRVVEHLQFALVVVLYALWTMGLSKRGETSQPWPEIDVMVLRTLPHDR